MDRMKGIGRNLRAFVILMVLISNIGCDQISKEIARKNINYGEKISLMSDYLTLTKVENSGAFLSWGHNLPIYLKIALLKIFPSFVLLGMLIFLFKTGNLSDVAAIGLAFIIGGGIGNLYDRVVYGSVTDFLHIDFQLFQTGIFNIADVSIMIGGFLLMYLSLAKKKFLLVNESVDCETVDNG